MANAYQWYPGHMMKARRMIEEDIRLIDLVIELVDARIPLSSRNPDIDELSRGKARLILLNKADLADPAATRAWEAYFEAQGIRAVSLDSRKSGTAKRLLPVIMDACKERIERNKRRGIKNRPMRTLIAGIPNVGKSTFINSFAGKGVAKTGNKPGVTKGKQWIRLQKDLELLDTPGILWPKQSDPSVGEKLAMIGSINDEILEKQDLAAAILRELVKRRPESLMDRYGIELPEKSENGPEFYASIFEKIAESRKALKKGGELDLEKAVLIVIDDFRKGQFGRITLDDVPEEESGK